MYVFKIVLLLLLLSEGVLAGSPADSLHLNSVRTSVLTQPKDPWLGVDKGLHFVGSMMVTIAVSKSVQRFAGQPVSRSVCYGFGVSMSLGALKELWDYKRPGHFFSVRDLIADLTGSVLGVCLSQIK